MMARRFFIRIIIVLFWIGIMGCVLALSFLNLSTARRSINVCAWIGTFDPHSIALFEKQTGVRVNLSYYESNEELLLKLQKGSHYGYDLIIPGDYAVQYLIQSKMLKKLDKNKLEFYSALNPLLLGHYFDNENIFSVPFEWAVFGLGVNRDCLPEGAIVKTWGMVFDPKLADAHKIIMTNDPLIAIPLASLYLYGSPHALTRERLPEVTSLLSRQYAFVQVYSDFRANYYLTSKNGCIAVASSANIISSMRKNTEIDFIVPEQTILTIENFAIPVASTKEDDVYSFMNFMMKPEIVLHNYERMGLFPSRRDVLENLPADDPLRVLFAMTKGEFERFHLVRYDKLREIITPQELQDLWVRVKT